MSKEVDLVHELGYGNWLDEAAGEAYVLGSAMLDEELVALGTTLSDMIRHIPYDNEEFTKVTALGMNLVERIGIVKKNLDSALYLDEVVRREKDGSKSLNDWEYDLVFVLGRYQIMMILPEYIGEYDEAEIKTIDEAIQATYRGFDKLEVKGDEKMMGTQLMKIKDVYDDQGKKVYRTVDFNHANSTKKSKQAIYYFDDLTQAMKAWEGVRTISGRRTSG